MNKCVAKGVSFISDITDLNLNGNNLDTTFCELHCVGNLDTIS